MNDLQKIDLEIDGMSCASCAASIQTYLSKTDGVQNASVNFNSETASIEYSPKSISLDSIKGIIGQLGYSVIDTEDDEKKEQEKQIALKKQRNKIFITVVLALTVMFISMQGHFGFLDVISIPFTVSLIILTILTSIVVFWSGSKFIKGAYNALKSGTSNMDVLIVLGVLSSYIYSLVIAANHLLGLNIEALSNSHEVYFETAAMIVMFIMIGNYLESTLKARTQTSIKKLKGLQAKTVIVIRDGKEINVPFEKVRLNDTVIIKSGDKIPVDGVIAEGNGVLDESAMTGESLPIEKGKGDRVLSGSILKSGFIKISAEKVGKDTMLSKIIDMVNEASNSKPQIQRLADRISAVFVPLVLIIAAVTFLVWYFLVSVPFGNALIYSVAVLIIACPCALGLASPMAVVIGVGRAAENGILFNDVEAIEKLKKVDTLCFDKTGTLTSGEMKVKEIKALNGIPENELIRYIFSVEKLSNHPIANSINTFAVEKNIDPMDASGFSNVDGKGVKAVVSNKEVLIGNTALLTDNNIPSVIQGERGSLYVGIDGELAGVIQFEDTIKPEAILAVRELQESGYELIMLSGDNEKNARKIADEVGIGNYYYDVLPDEKQKIITLLQSQGKNVAMIGDGINDAPSLAKANVGIAIGTGTDIAIDSADVILVKGNLESIYKAIQLSGKTVRVIKQNIFWAFFYNTVAIPAAAGVLAPIGIIISPVIAAMLMAFSDVVTVVGNSMRLKYMKLK
ncbi:MAG: cadmium-translocating P-type ATPase [Ignavibacteriae bacterium]|nr:cadmium-translocating P-type ATPase [Ignavibacteriota bacterium]MCB9244439.1 cadmium-translocating P-type ATPase [Ignavibacteriales bacterium]